MTPLHARCSGDHFAASMNRGRVTGTVCHFAVQAIISFLGLLKQKKHLNEPMARPSLHYIRTPKARTKLLSSSSSFPRSKSGHADGYDSTKLAVQMFLSIHGKKEKSMR